MSNGGALYLPVASGSSDSGSTATTASQDTTGFNLLLIGVAFYLGPGGAGGGTDLTVSDNKSNSWTAGTRYTSAGGNYTFQFFYCYNPSSVGTGHTFKATSIGGDCYPAIFFVGAAGALSSPYDQHNGTPGSGSNVTLTSTGSITPGSNNEVVVAGVANNGTGTLIDRFPFRATFDAVSGQAIGGGIACIVQGAAAAVNPTWTWTTASDCSAAIVSFKLASSTASTGSIQVTGASILSSGDATGFPRSNAFDSNFSDYWNDSGTGGWVGLDLGASVSVTGYEITPQPSSVGVVGGHSVNLGQETALFGATVQWDTTSAFGSPTTAVTIPSPPNGGFNPPNVHNPHSISATSAQFWRLKIATGVAGFLAKFSLIGVAGTANAPYRPCRPKISVGSDAAVSGSTPVTITSATTSASIYYTVTTDGSQPALPTQSSTLYTGTFTQAVGSSGTRIRAVAIDNNCAVAVSIEANQAYIRNYQYGPGTTYYDTNWDVAELHNPSICEWPLGSGNYWFATSSANVGWTQGVEDQIGRFGIWFYSGTLTSTGFSQVVNHGNVISTPTGSTYDFSLRPSLQVSPTGALTLFTHIGDSTNTGVAQQTRMYSCMAADPTVNANWTDHGNLSSFSAVGDSSRATFKGNGYVFYSVPAGIDVQELGSDFLSVTGSSTAIPSVSAGAESPVAVQWNGTVITVFDDVGNYYDSTQTYDVNVATTADPLTSGDYSSLSNFFASDPVGTSLNAQPASIFVVPNKKNGFQLNMDHWVGGRQAQLANQYGSQSVFTFINVSGSTPASGATGQWDWTTFTSSSITPSQSSVPATGTVTIQISSTNTNYGSGYTTFTCYNPNGTTATVSSQTINAASGANAASVTLTLSGGAGQFVLTDGVNRYTMTAASPSAGGSGRLALGCGIGLGL